MFLMWQALNEPSFLGYWASLLSIVTLLVGGYTAVRTSNVARWIQEDRNAAQGFQNPVDIYFSIQKAQGLLEHFQSRWDLKDDERVAINHALKNLHTSAAFLANYFYFVDGPQVLEANVYLAAGRFFQARREPSRARDFYQKALDHDRVDKSLGESEKKDCLSGLMACNLLLWDFDGIARVQRMAGEASVVISPSHTSGRLVLRCLAASLWDALKNIFLFLRGSKGRVRTLKKP